MRTCLSLSIWRIRSSSAAHRRYRHLKGCLVLLFLFIFVGVGGLNEFDEGTVRLRKRYPHGSFVTCHPCTARALLSLHNTCMITRLGTDYPKMFSCLSMRHYSMLTTSLRIKYLISMSHLKSSLNHLLFSPFASQLTLYSFFLPSNHSYLHVWFRIVKWNFQFWTFLECLSKWVN